MPKYYKKKSYRKKRYYEDPRINTVSTVLNLRRGEIVPDVYEVKLRLSQGFKMATNFSDIWTEPIVIKGNSPYNIGVNKPLGMNEMENLYQKYTITATEIKVNVVNQNENGVRQRLIGVTPVTGSNWANWQADAASLSPREQPYGQWTIAPTSGTDQYEPPITLRNYMTTSKIYGITRQKVQTEDEYSAATGDDPSATWYWILWFDFLFKPSTTVNTYFDWQVDITYYCKFWNTQALVTN